MPSAAAAWCYLTQPMGRAMWAHCCKRNRLHHRDCVRLRVGDGSYKWKLPLQVGKTFGEDHKWFTYAEAGFSQRLDGSGSDGGIK